MKFIELFAGIGGFRYGLERVCFKNERQPEMPSSGDTEGQPKQLLGECSERLYDCVWANEWDKYAAQIYRKKFGEGELYEGDITKINPRDIPDHDLLVGGFPCQAFSIAGKRAGFDDTRGTLFFEVARILRDRRPRCVLLENVKGLLSHDGGKTFQTILKVLSDIGYTVEWQILNSKNFGVPQNRERVFIVGHLRGESTGQIFPIGESDEKSSGSLGLQGTRQIACSLRATDYKGTHNNIREKARGSYIMRDGRDNRSCLRAGRTPVLNTCGGGNTEGKFIIKANTKKGYEEVKEGDSLNLSVPSSKTRRGRVGKGVSQTIDTGMHQHTIKDMRIRRLTPTECERLQGFPDGWTEGLSDTQRYRCLGNAVTTNVITAIGAKIIQNENPALVGAVTKQGGKDEFRTANRKTSRCARED